MENYTIKDENGKDFAIVKFQFGWNGANAIAEGLKAILASSKASRFEGDIHHSHEETFLICEHPNIEAKMPHQRKGQLYGKITIGAAYLDGAKQVSWRINEGNGILGHHSHSLHAGSDITAAAAEIVERLYWQVKDNSGNAKMIFRAFKL